MKFIKPKKKKVSFDCGALLLYALSGSSNSEIVPHVADAWKTAEKKSDSMIFMQMRWKLGRQKMFQGAISPNVWYIFWRRNKEHSNHLWLNVGFGLNVRRKKIKNYFVLMLNAES